MLHDMPQLLLHPVVETMQDVNPIKYIRRIPVTAFLQNAVFSYPRTV